MATAYTSLLGLALPVTGELTGTWGDVVNDSITSLLDSAISGTTTISTDGDVTLTTNNGAADQSRQAVLLFTGARTAVRTITAPARSKVYVVINSTTGGFGVKVVGAGPTTGVTIPNGVATVIAWNGSDFVSLGSSTIGNLTVNGNLSVTGASEFTGTVTGNGNWVIGNADTDTVTQAASYVNGTQLRSSKNASDTLNLAAFDVDGGSYTNLVTLTAGNTPTLTLTSAGAGTINNMSIGATTASTGTFTTLTATANSAFTSTGALTISKGDTSQRPTPVSGMLRFNTQTTEFEGYNGTAWSAVGGGAQLSNDTSTATDVFPLFASATTGAASTLFTSNAQYLFKPSTGELSVKAPRASNGIVINSATVTSNYTIAAGDNGMSAGPVSVAGGVTVTVSAGSVWTVL